MTRFKRIMGEYFCNFPLDMFSQSLRNMSNLAVAMAFIMMSQAMWSVWCVYKGNRGKTTYNFKVKSGLSIYALQSVR